MTSKTSSNNELRMFGRTYLYALNKIRGTFFLYLGLSVLFLPVIFSLVFLSKGFSSVDSEITTFTMLSVQEVLSAVLIRPLTILFIIVFSVQLFGYMHKKRSVDTFHALPVRRLPLMGAQLLAELTALFVPLAAVNLLVLAIAGMLGGNLSVLLPPALGAFGYLMLGLLACVAFVVFMLVASGTVMDAVVSAAVLSVAYPVLVFTVEVFWNTMIPGYSPSMNVTLMTALTPFVAYFVPPFFSPMVMGTMDAVGGYRVPLSFTLWWVAFILVLFVLSFVVYDRRKSEYAESVYSFSPLKVLMKLLVSASSGISLALIAFMIYSSEMVFILFGLLGALAANTVVEALYSRGLRRFMRGSVTWVVVAVAFVVFYAASAFGLFNFVAAAPSADDVAVVQFYVGQSSAEASEKVEANVPLNEMNGANIRIELHEKNGASETRAILAENLSRTHEGAENIARVIDVNEQLFELLPRPYKMKNNESGAYMEGVGEVSKRVNIVYTLQNGRRVERIYDYGLLEGTAADKWNRLADSVEEVPSLDESLPPLEMLLGRADRISMDVERRKHAEELEKLEQITDLDKYNEYQDELFKKYGDPWETEYYSMDLGIRDLPSDEAKELVRLLTHMSQCGDMYNTHVHVSARLNSDEIDSPYVQKMLQRDKPFEIVWIINANFMDTLNPELAEFVAAHDANVPGAAAVQP